MAKKKRRSRAKLRALWLLMLVVIVASGGSVFVYLKPVPAAAASVVNNTQLSGTAKLNWPALGSAAVGAVGYGVFASHGSAAQIPTASTAKLITVLAVLKKHPLNVGEQGPTITLSAADVLIRNQYLSEDGSNTLVTAGEQITEYQALESLLLPSSNNMADSLAIWAFGSLPNYQKYATDMLTQLGLHDTTVGTDASGFSPTTTSTASDLVQIGSDAMASPIVAQIVAQPTAVVPVAGTIRNVNYLLGKYGITGVKTGSNDQDGGCYIFSADYTPAGGSKVTVVGVIMGVPTLAQALAATPALLQSTEQNIVMQKLGQAGQVFGTYTLPWDKSSVNAIVQNDVSVVGWQGSTPVMTPHLEKITGSVAQGSQIGTLQLTVGGHNQTVPLVLEEAVAGPSIKWRIQEIPSQVLPNHSS